jgi:hypothetical protein
MRRRLFNSQGLENQSSRQTQHGDVKRGAVHESLVGGYCCKSRKLRQSEFFVKP